jgi:hypothetical protein
MIATAPAQVRKARAGGLLAGMLFVVLAGVLGMHGLGSHGVGGLTHMATATHVAMDRGLDDVDLTGPNAASPPVAAALEGGDRHGMGMGLGELCVAVLSALGLVVLLAGRRCGRGQVRPFLVALSRAPLPRARDPDAPSVTQLSVLRR